MKADFSRSTFEPAKHYSGVLLQQGRVSMDADWNEQLDIVHHHERTALYDVIGPCGAPEADDGFEVTATAGKLSVGGGRYYVDGILVENPAKTPVDAQPYWPGADLPTDDGLYAVILDVHERLVTALQDPEIREVALGGADHGARRQVVWQARLVRTAEQDPKKLHCDTIGQDPDVAAYTAASTGWVQARTELAPSDVDPCTVPAEGGYRGMENQLYRVEIRQGTHELVAGHWKKVSDEPMFTWSRENGSVVTRWLARSGPDFTVSSLGRDRKLGFAPGQWVELHADGLELARKTGPLYRVTAAEGDILTLDLGSDSPSLASYVGTPRIRRWDAEDGELSAKATWTALEDGLQVKFKKNVVYRTGDHWLIPARSLTGLVEWSPDQQTPHGPAHHHCVLAIAKKTGNMWSVVHDCRELFPAATAAWDLHYVSGDGQHGLPGDILPVPLEVRVSNGGLPIEGAYVEFRLDLPDEGELIVVAGSDVDSTTPSSGARQIIRLRTKADGHAAVQWRLGNRSSVPRQTVTVVRYRREGTSLVETPSRIVYNGTILRAQDVRYDAACKNLAPAKTVADALDRLCANAGLYYGGGDGQVGRPGEVLPLSLRVRVANGVWPKKGALVRYEVLNQMSWGRPLSLEAAGSIKGMNPVPWGRGRGTIPWSDKYVVETDADGHAQAQWMLGTESRLRAQRVRATLLDADGHDTDQSVVFAATIARSDPKVRVVLTDGREVDLPPGSAIPMAGFAGLRFLDLLVAMPASGTPEMAWWPGVRVTLMTVIASTDTSYGLEFVLPGFTEPQGDDSVLWWYQRPKDDTDAAGFARMLDTTLAERASSSVSLEETPFARVSGRVALRDPIPSGDIKLESALFAAAPAPVAPAPRAAARKAARPATTSAKASAPAAAAPTASAAPAGSTPPAASAPPITVPPPTSPPSTLLQRFLLRVHLRPWMFPEDCSGNAADFECWYWLDPRGKYKVGG